MLEDSGSWMGEEKQASEYSEHTCVLLKQGGSMVITSDSDGDSHGDHHGDD